METKGTTVLRGIRTTIPRLSWSVTLQKAISDCNLAPKIPSIHVLPQPIIYTNPLKNSYKSKFHMNTLTRLLCLL
jgi:hypothetical protein